MYRICTMTIVLGGLIALVSLPIRAWSACPEQRITCGDGTGFTRLPVGSTCPSLAETRDNPHTQERCRNHGGVSSIELSENVDMSPTQPRGKPSSRSAAQQPPSSPEPPESSTGNWITDQRTKCKVWIPDPKINRTAVTWSGSCKNGFAEGEGTLEWFKDGNSIEVCQGKMREGKLNGHGFLTLGNFGRFEGEFLDNQMYGHLVFIGDKAGGRFEGEYRDAMPNGHGVFTDASGNRSEGEWHDGALGNSVYFKVEATCK